MAFPIKNIPILKLTAEEEEGSADALAGAIGDKLRWFADEGGLTQIALGLRGWNSPSYQRVQTAAQGIARGMEPLKQKGFYPILVVENDMAKVLGQALAALETGRSSPWTEWEWKTATISISARRWPPARYYPVVIKTLVFHKQE